MDGVDVGFTAEVLLVETFTATALVDGVDLALRLSITGCVGRGGRSSSGTKSITSVDLHVEPKRLAASNQGIEGKTK